MPFLRNALTQRKNDMKDKSFLLGGLFAAVIASLCCVGPVIFAVLGISTVGILGLAESLRPLFIVIALGFLGVAFYLTYRRKPSAQCESDSHCSTPTSQKKKRIALWSSAFLILSAITFPYWSALGSKTKKWEGKGKFVEKSFYVKGMTCAGCIASVEKALLKEKSKIQDFNVRVGEMKIRFDGESYEGGRTDCLVAKLVEGETPYSVYLDKTLKTKPCE